MIRLKYLVIFVSILFILFSCNRKKRDTSSNTLVVHFAYQTKGLHPTNEIDFGRSWIFDLIHRSLIENDIQTNRFIPALLTELPQTSPDGKLIRFQLRNDIKWDDGSPCTLNDVMFSIKAALCPLTNNPSLKGTLLNVIDSISIDSLTENSFTIYTKGFHRSNQLMLLDLYIIQESKFDPQHALEIYSVNELIKSPFNATRELVEWANKFNGYENSTRIENITGLGPYRLSKWEPGQFIELIRKKNWWGENDTIAFQKAFPEKIVFRVMPDEHTSYAALKKEEFDLVNRITSSKALKLKKNSSFCKNYNIEFTDQYAYSYIGLNMKPDGVKHADYFSDQRVRRAMAHLTPVDEILKIFNKGLGYRMTSCVYKNKKEYNKSLTPIELNLEKAKSLLADAGWKDSNNDGILDKRVDGKRIDFRFQLNYTRDVPGQKEICLLIKDYMIKAGIEMQLNGLDFVSFYNQCYNHDFDAYMGAWLGSSGFEDYTQLFSTAAWINHGENFVGFGTVDTDSLLYRINTSINDSTYIANMNKFQEMVYQEQPYIFLTSNKNKFISHKRYTNSISYAEKPNILLNYFRLENRGSFKTITP